MQRIGVKNAPEQTVGAANSPVRIVGVKNNYRIVMGADPYEGAYEVTPSSEKQILQTADKHTMENIVVNPIPKNYGLITYNGYELTIS